MEGTYQRVFETLSRSLPFCPPPHFYTYTFSLKKNSNASDRLVFPLKIVCFVGSE